ncbi:hypothetical protein BDN70DRAFT_850025 [Pholiota conissans]|uniref:Uncharacterized protein n=1 Tax=Pholiota conissans TaxID=109636 RepID=A0A9P6D629_9AGAR|nr:hypothetical protein BDN70DRAFT_850025 [Pholiota conissans]
MLIILLLFASLRTLQGSSISSPLPNGLPFSTLDFRDTQLEHLGQRSVNDIVISCFATIFACTWSAIHPNIPAPTDCWWTRFKRQVTTMVCALLAPEVVTAWALRQRLAAKEIMEEYNETVLKDSIDIANIKGRPPGSHLNTLLGLFKDAPLLPSSQQGPRWTLAHGFFIQMGGFMLSEGGRPIHTLNWKWKAGKDVQLLHNIQNEIIDPPRLTEEDIQDRSKGDAIAKTFILLQTTWFIVQCIARWLQHLPVTELEVVTLGFALLNGITYALWWHKPQNVGRPVFLELKTQKSPLTIAESDPIPTEIHPSKGSWLRQRMRRALDEQPLWALPIMIPFTSLVALLRPLFKLIEIADIPNVDSSHLRVPMFYTACESELEDTSQWAMMVIGVLFGSVHLIPSWFLDFSSPLEMWLWRSAAIDITAGPLLVVVGLLAHATICIKEWHRIIAISLAAPILICIVLYPLSRIILLFLSLISLRSLPAEALQTVEWTTFIPHL